MIEKLEILTAKRNEKTFKDFSSKCEQIKIDWVLEGSAGVLTTSYIELEGLDISEGDVVTVKFNDNVIFYGWVFSKSKSPWDSTEIKVYDIKRYLAYKDVDVTGNETINQCFERICKMMKINYTTVNTGSYILPNKIHDGQTYNDMLQYAIDQTFIATGEWFCIRANGRTLELVSCNKQQKDLTIGDGKLLTDYKFTTDIENTYTSFKIQREVASEEQKNLTEAQKMMLRKNYVIKDDSNIEKWGDLQYYEKKDSKWTDTQINQHLAWLKTRYNKQTKSLKLNCLGDINCIPGNMIKISIENLQNENLAKGEYVLIKQATHTFNHNDYTMELTVEVNEQ